MSAATSTSANGGFQQFKYQSLTVDARLRQRSDSASTRKLVQSPAPS